MPIYEYECAKCRRHFEYMQSLSEPQKKKCEECGGKLERLISASGFILKGGGWYKDLYASPRPGASGDSSSGRGDGSSSKGESSGSKSESSDGKGASSSGASDGSSGAKGDGPSKKGEGSSKRSESRSESKSDKKAKK